jgi:phosphatidylserine/phosphatidylglycerophosphate/cardiolipin synthase-like enzyme
MYRRRSAISLGALLVLALVAVFRYFPDLKRQITPPRSTPRATAPVAVPGSASLEGPYFSDSDRVGERIIAAINHTKSSLDLAIYDLTHPGITAALEDAQRRGVRIRIVADQRQAAGTHSEIPFLIQRGIPVRLSRGYRGDRSIMHNKFAVFDGRLAVTGSFNWTTSADSYNFENAVFISDPAAVARFAEAFERVWEQAA